MYHEKQIQELCALHTLNNLFQDSKAFTKSYLDNICKALSPEKLVNPHKSILGTGNYDINVIMAALTTKGCGIIWFDKRKDPSIINMDNIIGFILNIPSDYRIGPVQLPFRRKHWIAIRSLKGIYYNLDSKLDVPEIIGKHSEVLNYIRDELQSKEKELFIVVSEQVERDRTWCLEPFVNLEVDHRLSSLNGMVTTSGAFASKPFNPPGLTYIDQEISSVESSQESNLNDNSIS